MELKTKPLQSGLAAIGGVLIAGNCCLPLGTFWIVAGLAGASTLLDTLRPYLLGLSIVLIAPGFWQARRARIWDPRVTSFWDLERVLSHALGD